MPSGAGARAAHADRVTAQRITAALVGVACSDLLGHKRIESEKRSNLPAALFSDGSALARAFINPERANHSHKIWQTAPHCHPHYRHQSKSPKAHSPAKNSRGLTQKLRHAVLLAGVSPRIQGQNSGARRRCLQRFVRHSESHKPQTNPRLILPRASTLLRLPKPTRQPMLSVPSM